MQRLRGLAGFPVLALGLAALSWVALLGMSASPYDRYFHHSDWTTLGLDGATCGLWPAGTWLLPLLFFSAGWLMMTAAMMLPTVVPLIRSFDRIVDARHDGALLHILLICGYLLSWSAFGFLAYLLDWLLHTGLGGWAWLAIRPWVPGATVLAIAGAFQFSRLKYHCLEKCRTPLSFVISHWHGPRPRREAFALGLAHGMYCVGCCWALMLLMFLVGMGNIGWMLILGMLMAIEKNYSWGRRLSAPLGTALFAGSGLLVWYAAV